MGGKAPEVQKYPSFFFIVFVFFPRITFWSHCHLIFGVCWVLKYDLQCVLCNILKRYHHRCFLQRWLILVREPQCSWSEFYWHCGVVAWLSGLTAAAGRSLALMLWLTHSLQSKGEVLLTGTTDLQPGTSTLVIWNNRWISATGSDMMFVCRKSLCG